MGHFLACHEHAFAAFGGVPVQDHGRQSQVSGPAAPAGVAPVFNPRYLDFARRRA
jgi:hypothetical protein